MGTIVDQPGPARGLTRRRRNSPFAIHAWALDQPDPARGFTRRRRNSPFATRLGTRPAGSCERVHSTTARFAFRYTLGHSTSRILREGSLDDGAIRLSLHAWALDQPDPARGFTRRRRSSPFATRLGTRPAGSCERVHSTTARFAFRYTLGHSTSRILREGSLDDGAIRLSLHAWALDQPDPARGFTRRRRDSPFATRLGTRPAGSCERVHLTTAQFAFRGRRRNSLFATRLGTRPAGSCERVHSTTAQFAFRYTLGHSTSRILRGGSLDDGAIRFPLHAFWAGSPEHGSNLHCATRLGARQGGSCKRVRSTTAEFALRYTIGRSARRILRPFPACEPPSTTITTITSISRFSAASPPNLKRTAWGLLPG